MTYDAWEASVSDQIRGDPLWTVKAYRLSLFLSDLAWEDASKLLKHPLSRETADQLYRAAGRIGANISEGYSRGTVASRIAFLEYALGSTRESRDWYYRGRRVLDERVAIHRLDLTTELIKMLLGTIAKERQSKRDHGGTFK